MRESDGALHAQRDFPKRVQAHPYRSRGAAPQYSAPSDTRAMYPKKQTTGSNRIAADTGHRYAGADSILVACSETDMPPNSVRLWNLGIQSHIVRASSPRRARIDWQSGRAQAP